MQVAISSQWFVCLAGSPKEMLLMRNRRRWKPDRMLPLAGGRCRV